MATVRGCFSKAFIGYVTAEHMRIDLVTEPWESPHVITACAPNYILHSVRGRQHSCSAFAETLDELDMLQ